MKKILLSVLVVVSVFAVGTVGFTNGRNVSANPSPKDIAGVWEVDADAPYRPHLFTFNADGTMASTNPTNVQENAGQPHGGTNDSVGMGVWRLENKGGKHYVVGTFEELNAFADNHQPTDKLSVSFKLQVTANGDGFDGPASARVGAQTFPSHLTGVRVKVDEAAVNSL